MAINKNLLTKFATVVDVDRKIQTDKTLVYLYQS